MNSQTISPSLAAIGHATTLQVLEAPCTLPLALREDTTLSYMQGHRAGACRLRLYLAEERPLSETNPAVAIVSKLKVGVIGTGRRKEKKDMMRYAMAYEHGDAYKALDSCEMTACIASVVKKLGLSASTCAGHCLLLSKSRFKSPIRIYGIVSIIIERPPWPPLRRLHCVALMLGKG